MSERLDMEILITMIETKLPNHGWFVRKRPSVEQLDVRRPAYFANVYSPDATNVIGGQNTGHNYGEGETATIALAMAYMTALAAEMNK